MMLSEKIKEERIELRTAVMTAIRTFEERTGLFVTECRAEILTYRTYGQTMAGRTVITDVSIKTTADEL